jgi:hypothetical protein
MWFRKKHVNYYYKVCQKNAIKGFLNQSTIQILTKYIKQHLCLGTWMTRSVNKNVENVAAHGIWNQWPKCSGCIVFFVHLESFCGRDVTLRDVLGQINCFRAMSVKSTG